MFILHISAATKQYVDTASFKQIYKGKLTANQTISGVANCHVMVGFVTITHDRNSDNYPSVSMDSLPLGYCRGVGTSYTNYCNFILFNFDNKSGTFFWSNSVSSCSAQTQNKALTGKITFNYVNSASLSLYAI